MFELEVKDTLTSWSALGHKYIPGVYLTSDTEVVKAASRLPEHINIRELPEEEDSLEVPTTGALLTETFEPEPNVGGMVMKEDFTAQPVDYMCPFPDCGKSYPKEATLKSHITRYHSDAEPPVEDEPAVVEDDASPYDATNADTSEVMSI